MQVPTPDPCYLHSSEVRALMCPRLNTTKDSTQRRRRGFLGGNTHFDIYVCRAVQSVSVELHRSATYGRNGMAQGLKAQVNPIIEPTL
eukprot:4051953-Amphidinium_carterae.1